MKTLERPNLTRSIGERPSESQGALTGTEPWLHEVVLSGWAQQGHIKPCAVLVRVSWAGEINGKTAL